CSAVSSPLSTPLGLIARRRGSRCTTALRLPLVPSNQPRAWNVRAIEARSFASCGRWSGTQQKMLPNTPSWQVSGLISVLGYADLAPDELFDLEWYTFGFSLADEVGIDLEDAQFY